jgi:hypothetical protein
MGFFDLFKAGKKSDASGDRAKSPAAKWADRAGDKRAQNYDRQEAIAALSGMGSSEAALALLKRFTFNIDPSITDQDEKEAAFEGVLRAGADAVAPVRTFSARAESLAWPMKILKALLPADAYVEELVLWLSRWDTEYSKFIDPKIQLLVELEEYKHPKIRAAVEPFLGDVNEVARFHAVAATLAQEEPSCASALVRILPDEESLRVKNKVAEGLAQRGWPLPEDVREMAKPALPSGFSVNGLGVVTKR